MKIGINLLYLIPGIVGGTETYALSLISALAAIDKENQYFLFLNRESANLEITEASNFHRISCRFRAVRRTVRYAWEQIILPRQVSFNGIDLLHSLGYVSPLLCSCPSVVTIPDLNYMDIGHLLPATKKQILRFFSTQSAQRCNHVITISDFSKAMILRSLKLDSNKITVTHLGPNLKINTGKTEPWAWIWQHYHLPEHYVVAFGGGALHKNIPRLIQAFARIASDFPQKLVLIGHIPANVDLSELEHKAIRDRIILTGYIPEEHISPLLSHADLFVLPSLYEGFGMPVLEAQTVGVAVACSTAGSLPEVAGGGAIFFDPLSVDNMAHTIHRCLLDAKLRAELRRLGAENVKRFSWEKTARETLAVYQHVYSTCAF